MNIGDKVNWRNKNYYVMQFDKAGKNYYHISKPNKDGNKPKIKRWDNTYIAFENELQEGWL